MFARSDTKYTNKLWAWSIVGWEFGGIYIDFVGPSTTWFKKKIGNIECESYGGDRKFWSFTKGPRENWHRPKKIGAFRWGTWKPNLKHVKDSHEDTNQRK